jgi:hypothetical protein
MTRATTERGTFMSRLIDFYRGVGADSQGRMLGEMWSFSDEEMEARHDFIQWMFPLREPSRFNPDAPLLDDDDVAAFHANPHLRANLLRSLDRFLEFVGLVRVGGSVERGPSFARKRSVWLNPNHNWLRVTRVLHCLRALGLEDECRAFFDLLKELYESGESGITSDTFRYWHGAAGPRGS